MPQPITKKATRDEYDIALFGTPSVTTRLDIGFRLKKDRKPTKGSIYGSVNYDTTRTNYRAGEAATQNHEPGVPGVQVSLWQLDHPSNQNGLCNRKCVRDTIGYVCESEGNVQASKVS